MQHRDHNHKLTFTCSTLPDRNFPLSEVLVPQYLQQRTVGKLNWETREFGVSQQFEVEGLRSGLNLNSEAPRNDFIPMLLPKGGASSLHKLILAS